jgi:hypothetical protein
MTSDYLLLPRRSESKARADKAAGRKFEDQDIPASSMICERCGDNVPPHYTRWCRFCRQYET